MARLLSALLAAAVLSGCLANPPGAEDASRGAAEVAAPVAAPVVSEVKWEGYAVVAAAYDVPAHFNPPESVTGALWKEGFYLDVQGHLTALEVQLDWTGSPGAQALVMAHSPHHGSEMREYTTEFSEARSQCVRIPPADLEGMHPGLWMPMFHALEGADIKATITVRAVGAPIVVVDGPHGHDVSNTDELVALAKLALEPTTHLPCDGPLGG